MTRHYALGDDQGERIKDLLPGRLGSVQQFLTRCSTVTAMSKPISKILQGN